MLMSQLLTQNLINETRRAFPPGDYASLYKLR